MMSLVVTAEGRFPVHEKNTFKSNAVANNVSWRALAATNSRYSSTCRRPTRTLTTPFAATERTTFNAGTVGLLTPELHPNQTLQQGPTITHVLCVPDRPDFAGCRAAFTAGWAPARLGQDSPAEEFKLWGRPRDANIKDRSANAAGRPPAAKLGDRSPQAARRGVVLGRPMDWVNCAVLDVARAPVLGPNIGLGAPGGPHDLARLQCAAPSPLGRSSKPDALSVWSNWRTTLCRSKIGPVSPTLSPTRLVPEGRGPARWGSPDSKKALQIPGRAGEPLGQVGSERNGFVRPRNAQVSGSIPLSGSKKWLLKGHVRWSSHPSGSRGAISWATTWRETMAGNIQHQLRCSR